MEQGVNERCASKSQAREDIAIVEMSDRELSESCRRNCFGSAYWVLGNVRWWLICAPRGRDGPIVLHQIAPFESLSHQSTACPFALGSEVNLYACTFFLLCTSSSYSLYSTTGMDIANAREFSLSVFFDILSFVRHRVRR